MAEEQAEERRRGVPKYFYWAKSPPKPKSPRRGFVNGQQKKFYAVQLAFRVAQFAAILAACLLLFSAI